MKLNKTKLFTVLGPAVLIALLTLNVIFWGTKKEGYHMDEMFAYNQVCNTHYFRIQTDQGENKYLNNWHDISFFEDFLTITDEEAFDLVGAWNSARDNDAHPPLFFVVLELVTSLFFRNRFTKWSGLLTNISFYILNLVILFLLGKKIFRSKLAPLGLVLAYGASTGAVNPVVFLRMYMMMTCFFTLLVYVHVLLYEKIFKRGGTPKQCLLPMLAISFTILLGALTHYYFLIFSFFLCLFFGLSLILFARRKHAVQYACFTVGGVAAFLAVCPNVSDDLFHSWRGKQALASVSKLSNFSGHLRSYIEILNNNLFGSFGMILVIFLVLAFCIILIRRVFFKRNAKCGKSYCGGLTHEPSHKNDVPRASSGPENGRIRNITPEFLFAVILFLTTVCHLSAIAFLAPYQEQRYIMSLYPEVILLVFLLFYYLTKVQLKSKVVRVFAWMVLFVFILIGYKTTGVDYLYKGFNKQELQLQELHADKAVIVSARVLESSNYVPYLLNASSVYQTSLSGISDLPSALEDASGERVVFYLSGRDDYPADEIMADIEEMLQLTETTKLFTTIGHKTADVYIGRLPAG